MRTKFHIFATTAVLAVGTLVGVGLGGGCAGESPAQEGELDVGEAVEALQPPTCTGGTDVNGVALGPVAAGVTICGQGGKTWLCDATGTWQQYVGAACTAGNVPPAPACYCLGGTDANGTALGLIACNSTICGSGNKTWICDASGNFQPVGASCNVGVGPTPPTVGCSGGSLADGTVLGLISVNTIVCGGGYKTWLCPASLQWQSVGADCSVASCSNGVLDPGELETDCGGACLCGPGQFCVKGADCANGLCSSNLCTSNLCVANNVTCPVPASACKQVGTCNPATGTCSAATNKSDGTACNDGNPATSGDNCQGGVCIPTATCSDGLKNQGETGADCGGPCPSGGGVPCSTGKLGPCAAGTTVCSAGGIVCQQNTAATAETCNGIDDDCDGSVDEGVLTTYYRDVDGDTYGTPASTVQACAKPAGYVTNNTDCNDANAAIRPSAAEVCNNIDDNCNGQLDEGVLIKFYRDADGDGYGKSSVTTQACSAPAGYVSNSTDCNDGNASVRPGATELCDSVDNNCSGSIDEGASSICGTDFTCSGGNCIYTGPPSCYVTISPSSGYLSTQFVPVWSSSADATSCSWSLDGGNQGPQSCAGSIPFEGSFTGPGFHTISLTANGPGGSRVCQTSFHVIPPPTCSGNVTTSSATWYSSNATSCTWTMNGVYQGPQPCSGTSPMNVPSGTTACLIATNPSGDGTCCSTAP